MTSEEKVDTSIDGDNDSCHIIAENIASMLESVVPALTSECCIYRVGKSLHDLNDAAYTPRVISIGPFHHGKPEMQFMEKQKERYLSQFVNKRNLSLKDLVAFTKASEESIRRCYAEPIELKGERFIKMVLLDASFIIEFVLRYYHYTSDENARVLYKPRLANDILRDLKLFENQLPFWFLEKLYNHALVRGSNHSVRAPFLDIVYHFFAYDNVRKLSPKASAHVYHFTDLIRTFYLPSAPREEPTYKDRNHKQFTCSAMDLHATGVEFKPSSSKCLFDIKFNANTGELIFPHFEVEDRTETLFRNLMALEQYLYPNDTRICDYILLVDRLVNTTKDVELLVRKGCIKNRLGGDDLFATLFNNLGREIVHSRDESYFCKVAQELGDYYDKPWHNWKATLKQDYFSTPWKIASTVAAVILLILTGIQTVNSFSS